MSKESIERAKRFAELKTLESPILVGTGALPLRKDLRWRALSSAHDVRRILADGVPQSATMDRYVKGAYWQGEENSCVAFSTAGMQSIFEQMKQDKWLTFDADELYRDLGGYGDNGIDTRDALEWDTTTGLMDTATSVRYEISNYSGVYPLDGDGINMMKAAIAANRPCVLAIYPPSDFGNQWKAYGGDGNCQSNTPVCCLHQICVFGYDDKRFYFLNSYSDEWGTDGKGSIAWSFLSNWYEQNDAYAYTVVDVNDPGLTSLFSKNQLDYVLAHKRRGPRPIMPKGEGKQPKKRG